MIRYKLLTIHPNPGPRDKSERAKEERRERRYTRRREKREVRQKEAEKREKEKQNKENRFLNIMTWNVQRMPLGTRNMRKLKSAANYANQNKLDAVLLTEVRASNNGTVWLGENENLTAVVHAEKAAIMLRGRLLNQWCQEGQKVKHDKRTISVKIGHIILTSTYMPVWQGNNGAEIENEKEVLKSHVEWASQNDLPIIGGDFNAHIGGGEDRPGVCGKFGLRNTNRQGTELIEWLEENGLCQVNSFYNHARRGTWFNPALKKWYELDCFIMKSQDRHKFVRKVCTIGEVTLSDHKPKKIKIELVNKKIYSNNKKPKVPKIQWEKLRQDDFAAAYKNKINLLLDEEEAEATETGQTKYGRLSKIVLTAAEEICGIEEKQIENPWMVGRDEEVTIMRARITTALNKRDNLLEQQQNTNDNEVRENIQAELAATRNELKEARKDLKRKSSTWELQWYESIIDDCLDASNRNDTGLVYKNLRKLGSRGKTKAPISTTLKKEDFKTHFQSVSKDRFENPPEEVYNTVNQMEDIRETEKAIEWREIMDTTPTGEEIFTQMKQMSESAPGEDGVRLIYLMQGGPEILQRVFDMVKFMFENDAEYWEDSLKTGLMVPLHKKGDRNIPHNFRGVVLLAMGSRILARVLATRLRVWSEKMGLLDDDQAGFRSKRSTADVTQIFYRIQEDTRDWYRRAEAQGITIPDEKKPAARLLDLRKAYPRVNKPALWQILENYGLGEKCLRTIKNLHETTTYKIKSREGCSEVWVPERGLREGCPTSPPLFNIFHQVVMRHAERSRKRKAEEMDKEVGIGLKWVPGSSFPSSGSWEKYNSEAKRVRIERGLFADDTTIAGRKGELEEGVRATKEVMDKYEERNNDDKEEILEFGTPESCNIRMLGVWLGEEEDIKQRLKRAGGAWVKVKNQLKGSKLSKKMQAKIVESCVESTLLFDCAVRTWRVGEIKKLQQCMDKKYRYIWSRRNGPPLIQMQQEHKNMFDVRRELGVKSVRYKIEKRVLERIGHVMRMEDDRMVKAAVLGWLEDLEPLPKLPGRKRKTLLYWKHMLKEAQINHTDINRITKDKKEWKATVNARMRHIAEWEESGAHGVDRERGPRTSPIPVVTNNLVCDFEGCGKVCASKAGLTIHRRKMHEISKEKRVFKCQGCDEEFSQEANLINHKKSCGGQAASCAEMKKCNNCNKEITRPNFSRHRRVCGGAPEVQNAQARVYVAKRYVCQGCHKELSASNRSKHNKICPGGRREVP